MRRYLVLSFGLLALGVLAVGLLRVISPAYPIPPMLLLERGTLPAVSDATPGSPTVLADAGAEVSPPQTLPDGMNDTAPGPSDADSSTQLAQAGTQEPIPPVPRDSESGTSLAEASTRDRSATPVIDTPTPAFTPTPPPPTLTPTPPPPTLTPTSPPPTFTRTPLPAWAQATWTPNPNATPTFPAPSRLLAEALPPAPEGSSLREIQERGWLIVGVPRDVPVFGYVNPDTGGLEGFEVQLAAHIAKIILGDARKIEYRIADSPAGSDLDVILARIPLTAVPEAYEPSDVYFVSDQALLAPAAGPVQDIQDLADDIVAVTQGSAVAELLLAQAPAATLASFDTYAAALNALESGQAAALAGDAVVLQVLVDQAPDRWRVTEPFARQAYAVAILKGEPELRDAVNRAVSDFKLSGEWEQAYAQFVPGPVPEPPAGEYSP